MSDYKVSTVSEKPGGGPEIVTVEVEHDKVDFEAQKYSGENFRYSFSWDTGDINTGQIRNLLYRQENVNGGSVPDMIRRTGKNSIEFGEESIGIDYSLDNYTIHSRDFPADFVREHLLELSDLEDEQLVEDILEDVEEALAR